MVQKIATYVFLDLETTGIPSQENYKTKITELSLVAIKRRNILDTMPGSLPRVLPKLTLCFNPGRPVQEGATEVSGLCNFILEYEPYFDHNSFTAINSFLNLQEKPVCLVAENGINFDFPILKRHLDWLKVSLAEDLLFSDSYHAFYHIMEARKKIQNVSCILSSTTRPSVNIENNIETTLNNESSVLTGFENNTTLEEEFMNDENFLHMKSSQEKTPSKQIIKQSPSHTKLSKKMVRKSLFPCSLKDKSPDSYKLKSIYERLLNRPARVAHYAENDALMALECAVVVAKDFVEWVDKNHWEFSKVTPMAFGSLCALKSLD